ncbi:hypothetical protein MFMK1_003582 [Metallumcola ferriviriculae]|uniref:Uncharacterized protein n=1 Tax=Metallumcola ferriviriculae TaxID=3039180 RepID=A0AAU0UWK7_9FIRM|nr:hypothetical protein MFMK1_003582 [Desulfitibacteraceae bacterium MK1]
MWQVDGRKDCVLTRDKLIAQLNESVVPSIMNDYAVCHCDDISLPTLNI